MGQLPSPFNGQDLGFTEDHEPKPISLLWLINKGSEKETKTVLGQLSSSGRWRLGVNALLFLWTMTCPTGTLAATPKEQAWQEFLLKGSVHVCLSGSGAPDRDDLATPLGWRPWELSFSSISSKNTGDPNARSHPDVRQEISSNCMFL